MTTRMIGRITSEVKDSAGHFTGLVGLRVSLHSPDGLFSFELGAAISSAEGFFEIKDYRRDRSEVGQHRMLELVVPDGVGRELHRFPEMQDEDGELLSKGDFIINDAEARGYLVTLGTGQHRADGRTLPGWGLTQGNRVVLLMDQDAFKRAAELIVSAKESVLMSQLFFPVPKVFAADATNEETKLIFDFNAPKPDPRQLPRLPDPKDIRPDPSA